MEKKNVKENVLTPTYLAKTHVQHVHTETAETSDSCLVLI